MPTRSDQIRKLYELSMMLSGDPLEVFDKVARMIGEYFGVRVVCLSEIRGKELYFLSVYADGATVLNAGTCNLNISPCATVEKDKDINIYERVSELYPDAKFLKTHNAYSYCGFPALGSDGEVLAVTCLLDDKPHDFSEEDQELLRIFGQRIAVELERKANLELQRQTEQRILKMSRALEQSADLVQITDKEGVLEYVNPEFERTTGYTSKEAIGQQSGFFKSGLHGDDFYRELWKTISGGGVFKGVIINKKKNGDLYHEEKAISGIKDTAGEITHYISTGRDITARIENEKELDFLAHYDSLTGLPNRALFTERMTPLLENARKQSTAVAVLLIDLDRFKTINDTLGHHIGDQMLIRYSRRLSEVLGHAGVLARLGGDEFAIVLGDVDGEKEVSVLAKNILTAIEAPLDIFGYQLHATASIGISRFPVDGEDSIALIKNADIAMYQAKDRGRNSHQFFAPDMNIQDGHNLALENDLRKALERKEFVLFYQPQVDITTGKIIGVEALLRWQHPRLGVIQPMQFIPLLEETGLITEVGYWVMSTACRQLQEWREKGLSDMTMAINISGRQFYGENFIDNLARPIREYDIQPGQIELEITENILMEDQEGALASLSDLSDIGFKIAIDDFGTGYSSLSYLRRFKVDVLKIDGSFIRDAVTDQDSAAITSAIIAMAHSLNLNIVAEGVENQQQLDFLKQQGCHIAQGYLFSKPLPVKEVEALLKSNQAGEDIQSANAIEQRSTE